MLRTVTMALLLRLARPLHTRRLTRLYADVRPGADYVPGSYTHLTLPTTD